MLFDRRYPSFRNFDSTIPIDVVRMKSNKDSLFKTSIGIVESKFLKLGYLTADQPQSGPMREQRLIVGIIMSIEMHQ